MLLPENVIKRKCGAIRLSGWGSRKAWIK